MLKYKKDGDNMANIVTLIQDELSIYDLSIKSNQERHQEVNK